MRRLSILALGTLLAGPAVAADDFASPGAGAEPTRLSFNAPEKPRFGVVKSTRGIGDWTGPYVGVQIGWGDFDTDGGGLSGDDDSVLGGVHAGYNHDFGRFVIGAEVDADITDIDVGTNGELDTLVRLKLRAGPDLGRYFVYGTVGAVYADGSAGGSNFDELGWLVGGGVDYQFNDNWVLGADLLYHEVDNITATGGDLDGTTLRVRASYRF
ncbi:porin family protein [Maritimibacter sp. 55A14]|uniref:outer membrane protein n=1 Tax=Maritimibacter sp. 55A14 TaxID=2174844 RepID=UPI000D60CA4C|nr:outer membrane beta-barrel protein [Maritimibacter sp. 55A14]PWE33122.1 porin family protein [Maritimibacter sp. 55A14]